LWLVSSHQKVQRSLAYAQFVATVEHARLSRRKPYRVVDYGAVHRAQILDEKCFAFEPDARVTARDFRLGIESRKINFRKDI
jgi:hypothetical protein